MFWNVLRRYIQFEFEISFEGVSRVYSCVIQCTYMTDTWLDGCSAAGFPDLLTQFIIDNIVTSSSSNCTHVSFSNWWWNCVGSKLAQSAYLRVSSEVQIFAVAWQSIQVVLIDWARASICCIMHDFTSCHETYIVQRIFRLGNLTFVAKRSVILKHTNKVHSDMCKYRCRIYVAKWQNVSGQWTLWWWLYIDDQSLEILKRLMVSSWMKSHSVTAGF